MRIGSVMCKWNGGGGKICNPESHFMIRAPWEGGGNCKIKYGAGWGIYKYSGGEVDMSTVWVREEDRQPVKYSIWEGGREL